MLYWYAAHPSRHEAVLSAGLAHDENRLWAGLILLELGEIRLRQ